MKQFTPVFCTYGAPMGRYEAGDASSLPPRSVSLFRVSLNSGGYDDGGAYWGGPVGIGDLYCARTNDSSFVRFARASSREEAAHKLNLPLASLLRKLDFKDAPRAGERYRKAMSEARAYYLGGVKSLCDACMGKVYRKPNAHMSIIRQSLNRDSCPRCGAFKLLWEYELKLR